MSWFHGDMGYVVVVHIFMRPHGKGFDTKISSCVLRGGASSQKIRRRCTKTEALIVGPILQWRFKKIHAPLTFCVHDLCVHGMCMACAWHVHDVCLPVMCLVCAWCVPGVCPDTVISTPLPNPPPTHAMPTQPHTPPPHAGAVGAITAAAACPSTLRGMRHRQPAPLVPPHPPLPPQLPHATCAAACTAAVEPAAAARAARHPRPLLPLLPVLLAAAAAACCRCLIITVRLHDFCCKKILRPPPLSPNTVHPNTTQHLY